jgi:hypothetical protein
MSEHPLWQPQGKILGQRLTPFLSKLAGRVLGGEIEEDGETSTVDLRPIDSPPGKGP